jgi:hypothetical protein
MTPTTVGTSTTAGSIIFNGFKLADIPNTNFYSEAEALQVANDAWNEIYADLMDNNDDFFLTQLYIAQGDSKLTVDANAVSMYYYELPTDFMRLRLLQASGFGSGAWIPVEKMTIQNYGYSQSSPGYRFTQKPGETGKAFLHLYNPSAPNAFRLFYYPVPATLSSASTLAYPPSIVNSIISYRVAIEIRRKQNFNVDDKLKRLEELKESMVQWLNRDDNRAESVKNVFATGFAPYV